MHPCDEQRVAVPVSPDAGMLCYLAVIRKSANVRHVPARYGLVYPGLGWVIWKDKSYLPESMCFYANYLGSLVRSITLNFSKGAATIIGQYYQVPPGGDSCASRHASTCWWRTHARHDIWPLLVTVG